MPLNIDPIQATIERQNNSDSNSKLAALRARANMNGTQSFARRLLLFVSFVMMTPAYADNLLGLTQLSNHIQNLMKSQEHAETCHRKQIETKKSIWQIAGCDDVAQQDCLDLSLKTASLQSQSSSDRELQEQCNKNSRQQAYEKLSARQRQDPNLEQNTSPLEASGVASVNTTSIQRVPKISMPLLWSEQRSLGRDQNSPQNNETRK